MNKSLEAYLVNLDMPLAFRLRAFYERYCSAGDEAYLHLAAHAAFPIAMTPDLLYKIWLNFTKDAEGKGLAIPYIAVSDLLLSSLYRATGRNTFEMPDGIRKLLLHYLRENIRFGTEREDELAHFLRAYLRENPQAIPSEAFRRAQEFIVKVKLEPDIAAEELLKAYSQTKHKGQMQHLLNLAEGELEVQEAAKDGRKNPLAVATEFVRGVQEYKRGNTEQGLELLERLKGRLSKGENGGVRVPLGQRILEKLPKEMNLGEDERPVFLGVFNSLVSGTTHIKSIEEKDLIIEALESIKELNSTALVDKTWKELNTISKSVKERVLIFHFAGHSHTDQLAFDDGPINPNQLADFLAQFPNLKLVFLNSMRSERFIEKLVESGIPVVLATYGDITDSQAISFAHNFYEQLALNTGLSEANTFAKSKPWSLETNSEFIDFRGFKPEKTTYYLYHKSEHDEQWKLIDAIQLFLEQQRATKQAKKEDKVFPAQLNKIPFLKEGEACYGRLNEIMFLQGKVNTQKGPIFVAGRQGIGKTTLLRAYIHQYHGSFKHILWLNLNTGLGESVTTDPDLIKLIEGQDADGPEKKYRPFTKLVTLLNTISGPNLIIIDSAKEKLETKKIIDQLPDDANWKTIISGRTNKGFKPIVINPLNNESALKLLNSHYQGGTDTEKSSLLKVLGCIPGHIVMVTKFLNQFRGFLSIQSLLKAEEKQKFNINKVAEFVSKSKDKASLGIKIKQWLELNGEKEVIQGAVLSFLDSDAEAQEINRVLVAWLNTNGAPSFIFKDVQRYLDQYANELASGIVLFFWVEKVSSIKDVEVYLKRHLEQHADKKETCNLMIYWLMYGGEPQAIRNLVKKHLDINDQNESSFKLISVWLGASRDIELVRDNVVKALNQNLVAEQIVLIVTAWLEAGGELDVVQESVQLFMQLGPMELFTSSIIQSWLMAGGETKVVESGVVRYLDKFTDHKEAGFIILAWLKAGGNTKIVQRAASKYIIENAENATNRLIIKAWLDAGGEQIDLLQYMIEGSPVSSFIYNAEGSVIPRLDPKHKEVFALSAALSSNSIDTDIIQPLIIQYLEINAAKKEAQSLMGTWLRLIKDVDTIKPFLIRHLAVNAEIRETQFLLNAWLFAGGDIVTIKPFIHRYLGVNSEQNEVAFFFQAWLNAGGNRNSVQEAVLKYLNKNATYTEASFVIQAWLNAGGDNAIVQESVVQFLTNNTAKGAQGTPLVINSWLEAKGDKKLIQDGVVRYLQQNFTEPEAVIVFTSWLNANGDKAVIQSSLKEYLRLNAEQPDAQFVLCAWLNTGGDKAFIQDSVIKYLRRNGDEKDAALVISAWLVAKGEKEVIQDALVNYILLNPDQPQTQLVFKAWNDTEDTKKISIYEIIRGEIIKRYIQFLKNERRISLSTLAKELNVNSTTLHNIINIQLKTMRLTFHYLTEENGKKKFNREDFIHKIQNQYKLSMDSKGNVVSINSIILPISKEVRMTIEDVNQQILIFEFVFFELIETDIKFNWDIHFTLSNDYKIEIQAEDSPYEEDLQKDILGTFLPSVIWVARGVVEGIPIIEFLFDATSTLEDDHCIKVLFFDEILKKLLYKAAITPEIYNGEKFVFADKSSTIWDTIIKELHPYPITNKLDEKLEEKKEQWRSNVAKNNLSNTIEEVREYCMATKNKQLSNPIIALSSSYLELKQMYLKQVLSTEEYALNHTKILIRLLEIIDALE